GLNAFEADLTRRPLDRGVRVLRRRQRRQCEHCGNERRDAPDCHYAAWGQMTIDGCQRRSSGRGTPGAPVGVPGAFERGAVLGGGVRLSGPGWRAGVGSEEGDGASLVSFGMVSVDSGLATTRSEGGEAGAAVTAGGFAGCAPAPLESASA